MHRDALPDFRNLGVILRILHYQLLRCPRFSPSRTAESWQAAVSRFRAGLPDQYSRYWS